ncbi:MAG: peptidoglycan DD-metalloendopeptidase family protein [Candidatus Sumerlaeia bacterium]|nr:peptidoglycan DD-metalloendopeptidase family protein [Candidatus Sumerlaeia bacterium]
MHRCLHGLILILVGVWILLTPADLAAQPRGTYYTVRPGESLTMLAQRFNVPVADLAEANRIRPNASLAAGSRIWIPLDRRQSGSAVNNPPAQSRPTPSQQAAPPQRRTTTGPGFSGGSSPQQSAPSRPVATPTPTPTPTPAPAQRSSGGGDSYTVRAGDSLWAIANRHGTTVSRLAALNDISASAPLHVGQVLRVEGGEDVPGGGVSSGGSTSNSSGGSRYFSGSSSSLFIWPAEGRILRRFADRSDHKYTGIDIQVPKGTEVRASASGRVVFVGDGIPGYGQMVIISHDNNYATCYAHLDRALVRENQSVSQGQVIARSGDTGRGSSPFLNFEIRRNGNAINPETLLP